MSLAEERSPFLQHGARQPVRWLPFGEAAFQRAAREDKPILLDIGAVWCHWCHVMDRESYEDEDTASLINELFVPVKVDRDERPDVDARYQRAVQTLVGQGGWPLTAFLTPEGDVFYGGTYFPPVDGYGRPSFRRVLGEVARIWKEEKPRALDSVRGIRERLSTYAQAEAQPGAVSRQLLIDTVEEFANNFDFRFGGFGRAPKFPNAGGLNFLLDRDVEQHQDWNRRMVLETLRAMARGGIYDQVGGGFHRYSVDARWIIPHFEKMSYDNGPLLEVYARAAHVYADEELAATARGIVDHYFDIAPKLVGRGGFPASQDADYSPNDDGDYWTWTLDEINDALRGERSAQAAALYWGVEDPASSMHAEPERHVLFRALTIAQLAGRLQTSEEEAAQLIAEARASLKHVRDKRRRPFVDETVYTGWSGLLISGFAAAARHAGDARARKVVEDALDRIWKDAWSDQHGLTHRTGDRAAGEYAEDHAHFAQALLDGFELTQRGDYLERARTVVELVERRFADPRTGAIRDRPLDAPAPARSLEEPTLSIADSPVAAGNAVYAIVLLRLAALLHDEQYRASAEHLLGAFAGSAARLGMNAPTYMRAVDWATGPVRTVVIVSNGAAESDELLAAALRVYLPRTTVRWFQAGTVDPQTLPPEMAAMITSDAPRAYVCVGQSCLPPVQTGPELVTLIKQTV
jgi:uncharacterized protein